MKPEQPRPPIPAILLEGDDPAPPPAAGPASPGVESPPRQDDLPESYGTGKLHAIARDPRTLYTHWDSPAEGKTGSPASQQLVIRVHAGPPAGQPVGEVNSEPGARHWFVPVERGGQDYTVELGAYQPGGQWKSLATSPPVATPPDAVSDDNSVQMATIGLEPTGTNLSTISESAGILPTATPELPEQPVAVEPPPRLSPRAIRTAWIPALDPVPTPAGVGPASATDILSPETVPTPPAVPTPSHTPEAFPGGWLAAYDRILAELARLASTQLAYPSSISSPFGSRPWAPRGFRLDVNAELVLYGGTEPDARVTIGGQPVELRPDGTFSHRFALPDGIRHLAVVAVSPHGDWRQAEFSFSRQTEYREEAPATAAPPF